VNSLGLNGIDSITSCCSREPALLSRTRVCGGNRVYKRERDLTGDLWPETLVRTRASRIRTYDHKSREFFFSRLAHPCWELKEKFSLNTHPRYSSMIHVCLFNPDWGPFYTTPGEFKNGGCSLKTHQMFSVHTAPQEFKNAITTDQFGFVFEENLGREITCIARSSFSKSSVSKMFSIHTKTKRRRFEIPPV